MSKLIKYIFVIFFIPIDFYNLYAQEIYTIGTPEEDFGRSITMYKSRFYIIGTTRKAFDKSTDYYLLELNKNGSINKKFIWGGPHGDYGKDVIVDDEGIFILGKSWDGGFENNDMFLFHLDFHGNQKWSKYYGGEKNDLGHKFIRTRDGGFAMIGHNRSVDDFGDVYIVKTDRTGDIRWENHFGGMYVDHGFGVIETIKGDFIIAGTLGGFYNPTSTDYLNHDADILIVKTDAQGNRIWEKTFGGTSHDWAKEIVASPDGSYLICGSTQSFGSGSFDIFVMNLDEDGNEIWMNTYGGNDFEYGETLSLGADGNYYLLGTSASFSNNNKPDHLLIKIDPQGETIWQRNFGGSGSDYSSDLVCTPDSGCFFTGWTNQGEVGDKDIVLSKISKNGDPEFLSFIPSVNDSIAQISVFPNPVNQRFSVIIDTEINDGLTLQLYNSKGAVVFTDSVAPNLQSNYQPVISSGLYLLTIMHNKKVVYNGKLVFQ